MNKDLLNINNLKVSFIEGAEETSPVENLSLKIKKGETVALVGESGSGKSLTAKSILGLLNSWNMTEKAKVEGEILFNVEDSKTIDLNSLPEEELDEVRGHRIGFIFQEPQSALNPVMTIGKQITETIVKHKHISEKEAKEIAINILSMTDLPDPNERYTNYPHQLSGGQLQRVMIALSISCNPCLLIADEPTTALDVTTQKQILELLKSLQRKMNMSILIITHDLAVVSEFADRVYVMYSGNILESGPVREVFSSPIHPYTSLLLNSVVTLNTDVNTRLKTREYFINEEGKKPGTILFDPQNRSFAPMLACGNSQYTTTMFTKVVR